MDFFINTKRKKVDRNLRDYLDRTTMLMQGGAIVVNREQIIQYATRVDDVFGIDDRDLEGKHLDTLLPDHMKGSPHLSRMLSFLDGQAEHRKMTVRSVPTIKFTKDGKKQEVKVEIALSKWGTGDNKVAIAFVSLDNKNEVLLAQRSFEDHYKKVKESARKLWAAIIAALAAGASIIPPLVSTMQPIVKSIVGIREERKAAITAVTPGNDPCFRSSMFPTKTLCPITIPERNMRMRILRDDLGALSVGLLRYDGGRDRLVYVYDLDEPVDSYIRELNFWDNPSVKQSFALGNCQGLDNLSTVQRDYGTLHQGDPLWVLACPTIDPFGSFDGVITATYSLPLKYPYDPQAGILWKEGFKIKPNWSNWIWTEVEKGIDSR